MKTAYTKLVEAFRRKDWQTATEMFRDIMEQKVAIRLAEEKRTAIAKTALTEGKSKDPNWKSARERQHDAVAKTHYNAEVEGGDRKSTGEVTKQGKDKFANYGKHPDGIKRDSDGKFEQRTHSTRLVESAAPKDSDALLDAVAAHPAFKKYVKRGDSYNAHNAEGIPLDLIKQEFGLSAQDLKRLEAKAAIATSGAASGDEPYTSIEVVGQKVNIYGGQD
jgi:hypothetical protein